MENNERIVAKDLYLRKIPYPYKAMLAICSDLDLTPNRDVYFETMKFLNTRNRTKMGKGVGLEVGNTIYFDMPEDQFSYWNTDDIGREMIKECIQSGHIDCLHSFGDNATNRHHADRAINELEKNNCKIHVWIDHATAPSNIGPDIMKGYGDLKVSNIYHTDLTTEYGVEFFWLGRISSVIGQNTNRKLNGIFRADYPYVSGKTWFKEFIKGMLSKFGNKKYEMHRPNRILKRRELRDGNIVYEFLRSNHHFMGISCCETADGLEHVLTKKFLEILIQKNGTCILYTHLGKMKSYQTMFTEGTKQQLRLLADYNKKVLITTTNRVLQYCRALKETEIELEKNDTGYNLNLKTKDKSVKFNGVTINVPNVEKLREIKANETIIDFEINKKDGQGDSVTIPFKKITFPL